ncbi:adenosine monophosphate deaminase, putative [Eimeria necatrix]|uniref:AMP deaminase n=1 Tax=Eimeria necatrix TaxID=51315 RepID=U6MW86_9EIME|nr:adenosine monophosphate deaminase, putative [Eimeria necatrix]CDJ66749.1 adenosine monophosphate deaminase, putative [Eimeria necatrix]
MDVDSFSRRPSLGKEVGWDDIFKNVFSKRSETDGVHEDSGPSRVPAAPAHLANSGVFYVKLQPSKDLAILASASDEAIQAVKTLANALGHRWRFVGRYRVPRVSPAVRLVESPLHQSDLERRSSAQDGAARWSAASQAPPKAFEGMSKEPIFDPLSVEPPEKCSAVFRFVDGVMQVYWDPAQERPDPPLLWSANSIPTVREYLAALQDVMIAVQDPGAEVEETKNNKHRDFYNCAFYELVSRKKYRTEGDTVVATEDGQGITLRDLFQKELGFSASEASVDHLNVHALGSCFQRFDLFNQKYNPFGQARLRDVFLKTDNHIKGRFLAELTQEVIADLDDRKLYHVYRKRGEIPNFGTLLRNVFEPLFDAVKDPQKHRKIFLFLQAMVGFDSVDDESRVSKYTMEGGDLPPPCEWTSYNNPPYSYWIFYMYANIRALNLFLEARNMRPLSFRPHCGEAGSTSHLAAAFLLADGINHGILLKGAPVLEYMFYLKQIGIAVSPLSNNALFVDIAKNPLYSFFKIGLNVSLSTDDPLMFHFTDEPLLEEYSIAALVSYQCVCAVSGFENEFKRHWLGDSYWLPGSEGNDMRRTNVSNIRLQYRIDTWREELEYMREILNMRIVLTANQQQQPSITGPIAVAQTPPSNHFLQVPHGIPLRVSQEPCISSPAYTVETALSPRGADRQHPSRVPPSPHSDAISPSLGPSNPNSVLSSPDMAMQCGPELQRRRSIAEQELDELSCAAEQLTLSMKLSLPPSQSEQQKP